LASNTTVVIHVVSSTVNSTDLSSCGTYSNTATFTSSNGGGGRASAATSVNCPLLVLLKSADAASVGAGNQIGFTITLINDGAGDANGATLSDPLPSGPSGSSVSWSIQTQDGSADCTIVGEVPAQSLNCGSFTLLAGLSEIVHVVSQNTTLACGNYDNTASFTSINGGGGDASAQAAVDCPTTTTSELTQGPFTPEPVPDPPTSALTIAMGASAFDTATAISASPTASGTMSFQIYSDSSCETLATTGEGGQIDAQPGPSADLINTGSGILIGHSSDVTFQQPGVYYWEATYSGDSSSNTGGSTHDCGNEVLTVISPTLTMTKTADAPAVDAGNPIGFTITLHNDDVVDASGVSLTDPLPSGPTGSSVSWSIDTQSGPAECSITSDVPTQVVDCGTFALPVGQSETVHVISQNTTLACGIYDNTAIFDASNGNAGSASATTEVDCPTTVTSELTDGPFTPVVVPDPPISYLTIVTGNTAYDTATAINASPTATGILTFKIYTDDSCSTLATTGTGGQINAQPGQSVELINSGNGILVGHSTNVVFQKPGTYYWQVNYSGEGTTGPSQGDCTTEVLTVKDPPGQPLAIVIKQATLAYTGAPLLPLGLLGLLLLGGGVFVLIEVRRRRAQ